MYVYIYIHTYICCLYAYNTSYEKLLLSPSRAGKQWWLMARNPIPVNPNP